MQLAVRSQIGDVAQRTYYTAAFNDSKLVPMKDSAGKLVHLLLTPGSFTSGSHVDFYDAK